VKYFDEAVLRPAACCAWEHLPPSLPLGSQLGGVNDGDDRGGVISPAGRSNMKDAAGEREQRRAMVAWPRSVVVTTLLINYACTPPSPLGTPSLDTPVGDYSVLDHRRRRRG